MKKIVFRADAAPHIGIGDLMSLINISKYFGDDFEKYFIVKSYKAAVELVKKHGVKNCFFIDESIAINDEIKYINSFIGKNKIDIVFFEITERKLSDYVGISKGVKKVAVNFDGYILDDLDLVIDWDVEAKSFFDTQKYPNTKFLLGSQYVILPKEFYSKKVIQRDNRLVNKKLLIAMGGADELDFTSKVVDILIKYKPKVELNIIIGSGYENKERLEDRLKNSDVKYFIKQNITNMLDEYLSCDVAIGAGGLTSSELVAAKSSAILIATYEHQIARCSYFHKKEWAKYLGYRDFDKHELLKAIQNPLKPSKGLLFKTNKIVELVNEL